MDLIFVLIAGLTLLLALAVGEGASATWMSQPEAPPPERPVRVAGKPDTG